MLSRSIFLFLILISSACSVYRSTGRESFESKAPASVNALSISATEANTYNTVEKETCWTQPSTDPLWNFDSNQGLGEKFSNELSVIRMNDREIQVCAKPLE